MIVHQINPKMIPKRRIIARTGILDPIEFWWVPELPEMIVPKSCHDRFCLKKSSQKATSAITNPESAPGQSSRKEGTT